MKLSWNCCCSVAQLCLFVTPWTAAHQASLSFTISRSLLKLMSIESVMLSNHLMPCLPLFRLPSIFPSIFLVLAPIKTWTMWNRWPVQVQCMKQGTQSQCTGITLWMGWGRMWRGGSGWGTHVHPWLIHVSVWQKPLQYCKVISLQLK